MTDTADGPKIGISISNFDDSTLRRVRQLGITTVHSSGGIPSPNTNFGLEKHLPWTEKMLGSDTGSMSIRPSKSDCMVSGGTFPTK